MTKTKHKYNEELESLLITMDEDQFSEWLKTNEIEYENPSLLQVMLLSGIDSEDDS